MIPAIFDAYDQLIKESNIPADVLNNPSYLAFKNRDMMEIARLAKADPELWAGILIQNRKEVVWALERYIEILGKISTSKKGDK